METQTSATNTPFLQRPKKRQHPESLEQQLLQHDIELRRHQIEGQILTNKYMKLHIEKLEREKDDLSQ